MVTHLPRAEQKWSPELLWEDRDHALSAIIGTVLEGYLLGSTLELRGGQRGVSWVCVLAGINSQKQSSGHLPGVCVCVCVCEREREWVREKKRGEEGRKEKRESTTHLDDRFLGC